MERITKLWFYMFNERTLFYFTFFAYFGFATFCVSLATKMEWLKFVGLVSMVPFAAWIIQFFFVLIPIAFICDWVTKGKIAST